MTLRYQQSLMKTLDQQAPMKMLQNLHQSMQTQAAESKRQILHSSQSEIWNCCICSSPGFFSLSSNQPFQKRKSSRFSFFLANMRRRIGQSLCIIIKLTRTFESQIISISTTFTPYLSFLCPILHYLSFLNQILFTTMGSSQSQQQSALFESNYLKELRSGHPYFGTHYLLLNRNQKQMIINKQIIFRSSAEYRQFIAEYEKIERKPFNVIYPKLMIKSGGIETCSNIYEVNAYFQIVGRNLTQVIRTQGCLTESKAWFLLNEVSKSLEIMAEVNRPHWAITPENIYQNSYQNYFIYDSLFVLGFDPQSFLMKRLENNELISEQMKARLQKGSTVSQTEGFQEDCYGLGFVVLFALTGVHPSQMPNDAYQRTQAVKNIFAEKRGSISKEMIQIVVLLTEREALRRMDNFQLRRLLKDKEACIIRNEDYQYQRSRRREVMTPRQLQMQFNPLRSLGNPHMQQFSRQSNHFQVHPPHGYTPFSQKRLPPQPQTAIRMQQNPLPIRIHEKHPQAVHHITQISDYPSDRSNALTRINSYDRLITKK